MTNEETAADEANTAPEIPEENTATGSGLANEQLDTIRELCNISLGAACSNLAVILNTEVDIPSVEVQENPNMASFPEPFAGSDKMISSMQFSGGVSYNTAFVLKADDAKSIASSMLGGGETEEGPLTELQSSAISEAFSQMMNASATSLASVLSEGVDVTSPEITDYSLDVLKNEVTGAVDNPVISVHFTLVLDGGQEFGMVQLMNTNDALNQVDKLMAQEATVDEVPEAAPAQETATPDATTLDPATLEAAAEAVRPQASPEAAAPAQSAPTTSNPAPQAQAPAPQRQQAAPPPPPVDPVTVQPVQFAAFDQQPDVYGEYNKNLDLVLDVTLNLTVQLGATELSIKQILELTRGSVIELDRIAGEPVDLLANGKLIAKGEVVVIEDNFGLRITSIVSPEDRLRGLTG